MNWQVYIIVCSDDTLYTGITTDIERRLSEHASGRGAKYFRGRRPKELVYLEGGHDRSSASKRELAIKGMKRAEKERLIDALPSPSPRLRGLITFPSLCEGGFILRGFGEGGFILRSFGEGGRASAGRPVPEGKGKCEAAT